MTYKLLSYYGTGGQVRSGLLVGSDIYDLAVQADSYEELVPHDASSLLAIFQNWDLFKPRLNAIAAKPVGSGLPLAATKLAAPILYPGVLYMAGANYADHLLEMSGKPPPDKSTMEPFFFLKTTAGTIVGPETDICLPAYSRQVDWEVEVAMVIGRSGKNIPVEEAMDHVAGYTILNDLSARDKMTRTDGPFGFDWIGQKCFDTAAPMGPWVTPADQIGDAGNLALKLWVNDKLHQDSNTNQMIFNYAEQIAYLSKHVTLPSRSPICPNM